MNSLSFHELSVAVRYEKFYYLGTSLVSRAMMQKVRRSQLFGGTLSHLLMVLSIFGESCESLLASLVENRKFLSGVIEALCDLNVFGKIMEIYESTMDVLLFRFPLLC